MTLRSSRTLPGQWYWLERVEGVVGDFDVGAAVLLAELGEEFA